MHKSKDRWVVRKQRQESVTVSSEGREVRERMLEGWPGQGMEVLDEDGSVVGSGPWISVPCLLLP